jgi:hypothetical protein
VLTSSNLLLFYTENIFFLLYKTSYLNKEGDRTEPSSNLVRVPWFKPHQPSNTTLGAKTISTMAFSITTSFGVIILSAVLPVVLPKGIMLNVVILGDVLFIVMMMAVMLTVVPILVF